MLVYVYYVNNFIDMPLDGIDKTLSQILEVTREVETSSIPDYSF
jgi:hypothetical protein